MSKKEHFDENIAAAREEKLRSMKNSQGPVNAPVSDQWEASSTLQGLAAARDTQPYQPPTMAEQAEKSAQFHFEEHIKAQKASSFLTFHPEFEEFIKLVRSGAIQFLVLLFCVMAASAEDVKPPEPTPALTASQQVALKSIDDDEKSLQQKWQILQAEKSAIMTEFSKEHAGWYLGPNNTPTKVATPPAPGDKK